MEAMKVLIVSSGATKPNKLTQPGPPNRVEKTAKGKAAKSVSRGNDQLKFALHAKPSA